ncbi:MAG: hypothetical protein M3Q32_05565, partial [Pseudomonadota bacterium]|nr:hypothetical protein [Pseudomonadota bacterium]
VMALWRRGKPAELLHHSDQGSQYADLLALIDDRPYLHHPTAKEFATRAAAKEKRIRARP